MSLSVCATDRVDLIYFPCHNDVHAYSVLILTKKSIGVY